MPHNDNKDPAEYVCQLSEDCESSEYKKEG